MADPVRTAYLPRERKIQHQAAGFASHAGSLRRECEQAVGRMTVTERVHAADHLREAGRECVRAADLLENGK